MFDLLVSAYSTISTQDTALFLGLNADDAANCNLLPFFLMAYNTKLHLKHDTCFNAASWILPIELENFVNTKSWMPYYFVFGLVGLGGMEELDKVIL